MAKPVPRKFLPRVAPTKMTVGTYTGSRPVQERKNVAVVWKEKEGGK